MGLQHTGSVAPAQTSVIQQKNLDKLNFFFFSDVHPGDPTITLNHGSQAVFQ